MQVRIAGRERVRWRAAATALGLDLSEFIRDAVRARLAQDAVPRAGVAVVQVEAECARSAASESTR